MDCVDKSLPCQTNECTAPLVLLKYRRELMYWETDSPDLFYGRFTEMRWEDEGRPRECWGVLSGEPDWTRRRFEVLTAMKMAVEYSSETLVPICKSTRRHNPEVRRPQKDSVLTKAQSSGQRWYLDFGRSQVRVSFSDSWFRGFFQSLRTNAGIVSQNNKPQMLSYTSFPVYHSVIFPFHGIYIVCSWESVVKDKVVVFN
jgi:hypothetical protein